MSVTTTGSGEGLLGSLTNLAATLLAIVHTRLDLLSADLEEDKAHFLSLLLLSLVALLCLGVGVVLVMILLVIMFWDSHRLLSLGVIAGFFLASGTITWIAVLRRSRSKSRLFSASLTELSKDQQQLTHPA